MLQLKIRRLLPFLSNLSYVKKPETWQLKLFTSLNRRYIITLIDERLKISDLYLTPTAGTLVVSMML